ncbi:MAG TPA: cell envelope integrity EipB family protein [Xanthobacteraceae bacterium]|nr:cell envelope integrity EipB family protein [Xanthobacteraceae bacterium]
MMVVDHLFAMRPATLSLGLLLLLSLAAAGSQARGQLPSQAKDQEGGASAIVPIALVPHRAIYDLSLGATRSNAQVAGVRGRILYDFDGNTCQGYSLEFRQVSELDTGEGKVSTTDLRSTTWEGADAKSFKFTSQNFIDENLVDSVDGHAEREASKTAVALEKPQQKSLSLAAGVVFPTEHMVRAINAAHAGQSVLSFPVYDGSETGDKVYDTLTVIGHQIGPGERNHDDAAASEAKLAEVPRWPVTVSYFERGKAADSSEQTPAYAISFELYANGISRALALDYNNFVITGKLASLEIKNAKPCR